MAKRKSEMTPEMRQMRARLASHTSWANTEDRAARTAAARKAAMSRFDRQVDPDGTMDPRERSIRAEHARKAFYAGMALKSAQARARKKAGS